MRTHLEEAPDGYEFEVSKKDEGIFVVHYKGMCPSDEEVILKIKESGEWGSSSGQSKTDLKNKCLTKFQALQSADRSENVWNLGYLSSDKEESNDTEDEEEEDK